MEIAQAGHHWFTGRYLAYLGESKVGRKIFLTSFVDKTVRAAHKEYWKNLLRHPLQVFDPVFVQSIGIIQAPDIMADGTADMCDSCPDMTYYNGELINSCRMDEYRLFGGFVTVVKHDHEEVPVR
jgi:hypothetical protein